MKEYHLAWLEAHPTRTKEWLADKLADGFDIHHIDGVKENNSISNLVLIECEDHMGLHGVRLCRLGINRKASERLRDQVATIGKLAYDLRGQDKTWFNVALDLDVSSHGEPDGHRVMILAKNYAKTHNQYWPLEVSKETRYNQSRKEWARRRNGDTVDM